MFAPLGFLPRRPLLSPESGLLAAICLLDLLTTCFWIRYREAVEGNPIMAWYLARGGTASFVFIKFMLCALPLFVAEWARRTRPRFVQAALRFTIAAYVTSYGVGVAHLNDDKKANAEFARVAALAAQPFPRSGAGRSFRRGHVPQPFAGARRAESRSRHQGRLAGAAAGDAAATTATLPLAE